MYIYKSKRHRKHSLQKIIIGTTVMFTLFIGVFVSLISAYAYNISTRNNIITSVSHNMNLISDSINANINELSRLTRMCQNNSSVMDFMYYNGYGSPADALDAYDRVNEEYINSSLHAYINRIIIGNNFGKYVQILDTIYSTPKNMDAITRSLPLFKTMSDASSPDFTNGLTLDPYLGKGDLVMQTISPIYGKYNLSCGYVSFVLNTSFFTSSLSHYPLPKDSSMYLTFGNSTYIINDNQLVLSDVTQITTKDYSAPPLASDFTTKIWMNPATKKSGYFVSMPLAAEGCYLTQTISETELSESRPYIFLIFFVILLIVTLIGFILSWVLYHLITVPVGKLTNRLSSISQGDFSKDPNIEWENELGDIGRGINELAHGISDLIDARINIEKQRNELEYKMLQSQINPHFIYNTLNSIRWMAIIQGADGIAEMTTAFSKLLRNISKGTQLSIPLSEELELLKEYFTIEQYRYGQTLSMTIHTEDESLMNCQIVKFTLQPIVENSIFHGIEPKGSAGTIEINITRLSEDTVSIAIHDDGVGMTQDKIDLVLTGSTNDKSQFFKQIGIANVNKRLRYEFGEKYGITIESTPGEGTTTTVLIPYSGE